MNRTLTGQGKQLAARLIRAQAGAIFLLACVFSLVQPHFGYMYFWGVVGGGIAVIIPTALFAWRAFAEGGARAAQTVVSNFCRRSIKNFLRSSLIGCIAGIYFAPA